MSFPLIIISTFVPQNNLDNNDITIMLTKKKKSWKAKILGTLFIKNIVTEVKHLIVNDFVDNIANIAGSTFLQYVRD